MLSGTECLDTALMQCGSGHFEGKRHDQDNRHPSKDTLTPDGVGPCRTRHTLFNGVIVRARCARFTSESDAVGERDDVGTRGSPSQC